MRTFFRAMKSIHKFKGECQLRVWLCQIAKNAYLSKIKKERREVWTEEAEDTSQSVLAEARREMPGVEERVIQKEEALSVYKILHHLEEPYKEVFVLRALGELSFREIGEIFGQGEGWAHVTFHRSRIKIRQLMKKGGEES